MYGVAFDLTVADVVSHHLKNVTQGYKDIGNVLAAHGFRWAQGSIYVTDDEDMANLFRAIHALRALTWFRRSVRDIRAFRIEQWSDFTALVKAD